MAIFVSVNIPPGLAICDMRANYVILFMCTILIGCSPARHLPEGEYLLQRNRIIAEDASIKRDELRSFIRQTPNRRILGFYKFHLQVYHWAGNGNDSRLRNWMRHTIGEPPIIYQPALANNTRQQFELYMQSKGYFNAEVDYDVRFRNKKAIVTYTITGHTPYSIRNLTYNMPDQHLAGFVFQDTSQTLIQTGKRYDADVLQEERARISRDLRNNGFFQFSRDFIFFSVDSTIGNHQVDIELEIKDPFQVRPSRTGNTLSPRHRRYIIDNIFIYPDYSPFQTGFSYSDTTRFTETRNQQESTYLFFHDEPLRIRPRAIVNNILLRQGQYFSLEDVDLTYAYLSRLRNFRFINLQFTENQQPTNGTPSDTLGFLNTRVDLTRAPTNAFTIEAEGMNTSGNLGVAGNVIYHNRNIFRGAENFNLRLKGALEVSGESRRDEVFQSLPFNTLEIGAEASVVLPQLLFPVQLERLSRTARPRSTILTGVNYRHRPDYTRYIYNLSYGFEWSPDQRKRQHLTPLEISSIKVFNDSLLQAKIPDNNPLILSRFKDHLVAGAKYSYIFSSQELGRDIDFMYFRGNVEVAGNLLYTFSDAAGLSTDSDGSYRLFNIPFAQFVKGDADLRYYRVFDENNTLAFRMMAGIGVPYGNTNVLPFIKSYYGGGANGIRAWRIYSLGPGGYQDSLDVRFDRYGDIKLEANIEYRFGIYRFWKAALFVDAGNVWFINENPQFPGGEFRFDSFYHDMAIGSGAGIRLDFDFFIVRLDAAFPLRNPALPKGNRWIDSFPSFNNWNFNLGIGYPF